MITRMKKYTFLVMASHYDVFLEQLREAGVVHVTLKGEGLANNEDLQATFAKKEELEHILKQGAPDQLIKERDAVSAEIAATEHEAQRMAVWGDFRKEDQDALKVAGYTLYYYTCVNSKWNEDWGIKVAEAGGKTYFVSLQPIDSEDVTVEKLNEKCSSDLQKDVEALNGLLVAADARIEAWKVANWTATENELAELKHRIDWKKVTLSSDTLAEGSLKLLEGFCPADNAASLDATLETLDCYYECEDPKAEDATPIQLQNGFFSRLFEPITRLYSLPNYAELDPTPFLAPFFTLFFGLCLGDGGYGLLVLAAGLFLIAKKPAMKEWGWMAVFLGIATAVVGILTGMFFGIELEKVAFLAPIREYFITQTNSSVHVAGGTYHPLMVFAIMIGIFQILFAMGFKVVKITLQSGFKYAVYDLAWLVGLVGLIVWAIMASHLSTIGSYCFYGLFGLCALFILFYSDPDRKFLVMNIGGGLWGTYNMISGLLGDILSYIRLFALGLAGGILGSVFNSLALQVQSGMNPWVGWLPMLLIMLFGHSLNFGLCIISSVVHPLRLTFVEFYKNAGFEGGGVQYEPFKK
ncbi:MAG: hypothetical protein MJZ64_00820 [Paludibacteraceae bacterium]|nr:hypothetical protein [Paludibacteraceae bacterium]